MVKKFIGYILSILCLAQVSFIAANELVYAEMEFPLSFIEQVHQYKFNPLSRFQTQVEGRILELTCDPLVDVYQDNSGRQVYRPCLARFNVVNLRDRSVLNFSLENVSWADKQRLNFRDVLFSLEYRKLNAASWSGNKSLTITSRGDYVLDAYYGDNSEPPKAGEFYFPIVNKKAFDNNSSPGKAEVKKQMQNQIGIGRYYISEVEENRFIRMKRRSGHPYYKDLKLPNNVQSINSIRMFSFPNARITRNEQFINGRIHLLTGLTQMDVSYISSSLGKTNVEISKYSDDSFTGFVYNCNHPYLEPPAVRRALNYVIRKKLMMRKVLAGEGDLISAPIPRRNYFYDLTIPPYSDSTDKAIAMIKLYRYWGLDVYEGRSGLKIASTPVPGPGQELQKDDVIVSVERKRVATVEEMIAELEKSKEDTIRISVKRGKRNNFVVRVRKGSPQLGGVFSSVNVVDGKLKGFPVLNIIANNPEGKNPIIKQICGALKEDMEKIGIKVKNNYLANKAYYPRLQKGDFEIAFRPLKLTGTPNLYRMFFHKKGSKEIVNINYGRYSNEIINQIAKSTQDITEKEILISSWKKAHQVFHEDPPYIYLWSRRHIVMHDPKLVVVSPNKEYLVPHGYKKINGLINVFSEVHLWGFKE